MDHSPLSNDGCRKRSFEVETGVEVSACTDKYIRSNTGAPKYLVG